MNPVPYADSCYQIVTGRSPPRCPMSTRRRQHSRAMGRLASAAALTCALLLASGCGGDGGSQTILADGSSTVGPFTTRAAESFKEQNPDNEVTVGISGTGGGFERFCADETDLSNASRGIEEDEQQLCADAGIEYVELPVANDALTVVVNPENDWATCLTVEQLKRIWEPGSTVKSWQDVDASFPDEPLRLYGPGTDSGTFDYFTDVIVGEEGASRTDYQASEDDNVTLQGVAGDKGALGYFGFSYYDQNRDKVKAVEIDNGGGCIAPSVEAAQGGTYAPLSRPLFVYAKTSSLERAEVADFLTYMLENGAEIAEEADFVPLTSEQLAAAKSRLDAALGT
jgi:phosphate transport system substrate-binding protein